MLKYLAMKKVTVACHPRAGDGSIFCAHAHRRTRTRIFTRGMGGERGRQEVRTKPWREALTAGGSE